MPSTPVFFPTYSIAVAEGQLNQVTIRIGPDGDGVVDVPTSRGIVEIVKVPGTALTVLSALKTHGRGFVIYVSDPSMVPTFSVLVV